MALVNDAKREINAKIVYVGPKGAGKSTAFNRIYTRIEPGHRSELKSMSVGEHQMLFFDFTYPPSVRQDAYSVRFHVYTLIAGEGAPLPWKMLLKGVDGVVLFADSSEGKMYANLESCAVLMDSVAHYGRKLSQIALSLQCNKRDLKGGLSLDAMGHELMPEIDVDPLPVTAITGDGLMEGLHRVVTDILKNLGQDAPIEAISTTAPVDEQINAPEVDSQEEAFDHCCDDGPQLAVEMNGSPVLLGGSTIEIPLRISGGACGKSAEFKVTVSVSL
ncbi:MAG: hypothetical protein HXX17_05180 [Geobacteraceae bacterium]|nr:hypothetical protein [Geobacteraceae bacterium]